MAKISAVEIPSLLFTEGSAPSTPASGFGRIYVKTTGLFFIGDNGVEVGPLAAASGATNLVSGKVTRVNLGSNVTRAAAGWADMDSTNLTITMTTGARRVLLMLTCTVNAASASQSIAFGFSVDATAVVPEAASSKGLATFPVGTGFEGISVVHMTDVLSAASHTFRPRWVNRVGSTTITAYSSAAEEAIVFSAVELYTA